MSFERDYQVLRPIDVDAILFEDEESDNEQPKVTPHGNRYTGEEGKIKAEQDFMASLGRGQVFMYNHNKPKSDAMKRYEQLKQIPVEVLLGEKEPDEDLEIDETLFNNYTPTPYNPYVRDEESLIEEPSDEEYDSSPFNQAPLSDDYDIEDYDVDKGNNFFAYPPNEEFEQSDEIKVA